MEYNNEVTCKKSLNSPFSKAFETSEHDRKMRKNNG